MNKKNKTQLYAVYKKLTSALRADIRSKKRNGKGYFLQVETKRKWGAYTYIKQNGLQTKNDHEKQRRSLYHNIGGNSSRR